MKKNPPPRKHHYLPQFYLRRFSTSGDGIFQIRKSDGRAIPVKIKDTAAIRDFHELDGDDIPDKYALETELAKVEGEMAPYLASLLSGGFYHRPTQMYVIQLLSMLRMRVPAMRDYLQASMGDVVHARLRMLEAEGKLPPPPKGLDDVLQADQVRIEIMNWALMEKMFSMAADEDVLQIFYGMQPTLLHAPMGSRFITSDQPVALFHPEASSMLGIGPESKGVVVSLPLSSRSALLLQHGGSMAVERLAYSSEVEEINRRTALMAQEWIFTGEAPSDVQPLIASARENQYGFSYKEVRAAGVSGFLMQYIGIGPRANPT